MSARAILAEAYRADLVATSLHGKAQHKTLQARLSEDIIVGNERSQFFRTGPGRFFLREFLDDPSIPDELRRPFPARRRFRELVRGPALALDAGVLERVARADYPISPGVILALFKDDCARYADPRHTDGRNVFIRSFVCVLRSAQVLTYRLGRYRDDRDEFISRRSIGFSTLVQRDEFTLFNNEDRGIVESGIRVTKLDLDIPTIQSADNPSRIDASLQQFLWVTQPPNATDLLALIAMKCPDWFEPTRRRLALNDLRWLDLTTRVNNLEDFDPWSRHVLQVGYESNNLFGTTAGKLPSPQ
jgi:hypothetical protein